MLGWKTSTPLHLHLYLAVACILNLDVRLAEDDEEVAFAGVLQVFGHVQVGVHAGLQDGDAAQLVDFGGVGVVAEGAGDQHVEVCVAGLAGGCYQVFAGDGAELRADEDARAFFGAVVPPV